MGVEELKGCPRWDYFVGFDRPNQLKSNRIIGLLQKKSVSDGKKVDVPHVTGVQSHFEYSLEKDKYVYNVDSEMKRKSRYQYAKYC